MGVLKVLLQGRPVPLSSCLGRTQALGFDTKYNKALLRKEIPQELVGDIPAPFYLVR
jgi:hypothetical protein